MIEHQLFVPPASLGDFSCKACKVRMGSYQRRPGMDTLLLWDDALMPFCPGKPAQASTHDDQAMHENCRDAVLQWWYWRQATKIDRLGDVDRSAGLVEYFTIERELA